MTDHHPVGEAMSRADKATAAATDAGNTQALEARQRPANVDHAHGRRRGNEKSLHAARPTAERQG